MCCELRINKVSFIKIDWCLHGIQSIFVLILQRKKGFTQKIKTVIEKGKVDLSNMHNCIKKLEFMS